MNLSSGEVVKLLTRNGTAVPELLPEDETSTVAVVEYRLSCPAIGFDVGFSAMPAATPAELATILEEFALRLRTK